MKNGFCACLLLLVALFPALALDKPIITVLDFSVEGVSESEMRSIVNVLSSSLFKTDMFTVIDVSRRETVLKELEFSMSGCTDESCYLEIGKMLSAEGIVVGSIGKVGSRYVLTAKLLQTETASTLSTADGIYADMDALLDGVVEVAAGLSLPFRDVREETSEPAVAETIDTSPEKADVEPVMVEVRDPVSFNFPAWASLAGGLGSLGCGIYFLTASLPLFIDYLNAKKAYDSAADTASADAAYVDMTAAQQTALDGNVNNNLTLGAGLTALGAGLGVLSAVLFSHDRDGGGAPVEVGFLPVPGGALLGFHVSY